MRQSEALAILNAGANVFLTGAPGAGKTYVLNEFIRQARADGANVAVTASTGIAATHIDGQTIHSWSGVGLANVLTPNLLKTIKTRRRRKIQAADVLIIDTAGRLQNKANLMDELGKIRRVTEKNLPVDEVLLVLDATTGQNGMTQAKVFAEAIGITGVVLSKLDGSAKGGIVISVQKELGVPVKLVGLGEGPDDLAPFDPEGFVDGILA